MGAQTLRLFVASPGDVAGERHRLELVVDRLNAEFLGRVRIQMVRWDRSLGDAEAAVRPEAAECDVVVAVFRGRIGAPLPPDFPPLPSGDRYPSSTAYEVLSAIEVRRGGLRVPDVYVFRYPDAPSVELDAPDRAEVEAQWGQLKAFFDRWFRTQAGEFVAAFQSYASTDDFAGKVEDCLRQWLAQRGFKAQGPVWDRLLLGSPFPGLAAFDADRGRVFFGREAATGQAIERLRAAEAAPGRVPFLLLIGASGSGKSSLLRAALLPRLVLPGTVPEVDLWRVAVMTADADPLAALAASLFDDAALGAELRGGTFRTREILARQLAGDPEVALAPLRDALDRAAARRQKEAGYDAPRPVRLALGIDQAERLFTEARPDAAGQLGGILSAMVRQGMAVVAMALRSDAYAGFQGNEALLALREDGATLDLMPPNAAELEEIVTRPVAACIPKLAFEQMGGRSLAALLVADARGGDSLPLLQVSLARLYSAEAARGDGMLRFADYSGMDEAVTQTASEALAAVDGAARAELPALVAGLVSDVATDKRTGAPVPVVAALDREAFEAASPARAALVAAFVAKRLLTAEGGARPLVRPVHEALLRIWPQAVAILAETASLIRVRHTLAPLVRAWAEADAKDAHLELSPALLDGAQALLARFGADLPAETQAFIAQAAAADAARRDRERLVQERRVRDAEALAAARRRVARRTQFGFAASLVLAALAGWQWFEALQQRNAAEHNLTVATQTATGLVTEGAVKMAVIPGISASTIKMILDHARQLQDRLLSSGETSPDLLRSQALALTVSADALRVMGDSAAAIGDATHAKTIMRTLLAKEKPNEVNLGGIALTDLQVALVQATMGAFPDALASVQEALTITDGFAKFREDVPIWQQMLYMSQRGTGLMQLAQGEPQEALTHLGAALAIAERRSEADPGNATLKSYVAFGHSDLATAQQELADLPAALTNCLTAVSVMRQAVAEESMNTALQDSLATITQKLGEVQMLNDEVPEALATERAALAIRDRLANSDPGNAGLHAEDSQTRFWIGRVLEAQGDLPSALESYRASSSMSEGLASHDLGQAIWNRDFAIASARAAAIEMRTGSKDAGLKSMLQARDLLSRLAQRTPSGAQLKKDLAWVDQQVDAAK